MTQCRINTVAYVYVLWDTLQFIIFILLQAPRRIQYGPTILSQFEFLSIHPPIAHTQIEQVLQTLREKLVHTHTHTHTHTRSHTHTHSLTHTHTHTHTHTLAHTHTHTHSHTHSHSHTHTHTHTHTHSHTHSHSLTHTHTHTHSLTHIYRCFMKTSVWLGLKQVILVLVVKHLEMQVNKN